MEQRSIIVALMTCIFWVACSLPLTLSAQAGCSVSVDAGADETFCEGNQSVILSAQITGDYLDVNWSPATGLSSPSLPTSPAVVDTTITYTVLVRSLSSINLINNGNFSQGDVGFTSSYVYGTGGPLGLLTNEGQYAVDDNPEDTHRRFANCNDHTTGNGNMMIVNASGKRDNFWCQNVDINAGTTYDFSAWVTSVSTENPAQLQFSINGALLGNQFNSSGNLCTWEEFAAQWTAPASETVEICIVNVNLTPAGNDFAIDDIAFREICLTADSITLTVANLNANWDTPSPLCRNDQLIPLNGLLSPAATPGGTWTIDGTTIQSLDPSKLDIGQFVLSYTVNQDACQQVQEQVIEVLPTPYAGAPGPTLEYCLGTEITVVLTNELQGEDDGGSWTETSLIPSPTGTFDPATSNLQIALLPAGNYTFNYSVGANSPCGVSENEIRIVINPLPLVDLGEDRALDCDAQSLTLDAGAGQNATYDYLWTDQAGNNLGNDAQLTVNQSGTYILVVSDRNTTCQNQDEIAISENVNSVTANVNSADTRCFDSNDGIIQIENPAGGTEPYLYSLNNNPFSSNAQYNNLMPGNYTITVMDAGGCTAEYETVIAAPSELQIMILTDDPIIRLGDSIELEVVVNNPVGQISWNPAQPNCANCQRITVAPAQSTTYNVLVEDQNGCKGNAQLTIQVKRDINIFVPNAFSPNEDGVNDLFYINAADGIHIVNLHVLDRWGNTLFQRSDFAPNDPGQGWDGRIRGQLVPSGVLVYALEIELSNGERVIQSGELAVIY